MFICGKTVLIILLIFLGKSYELGILIFVNT